MTSTANRIGLKVTFSDGDYLMTEFNGSLEDAERYYVGQWSDHYPDGPDGREVMRQAVKVEQLKTGELVHDGQHKLGLDAYDYWRCIDCGTTYPVLGWGKPSCNGHKIDLCPFCRPDSEPWKNGRGE